MERTTMHPGMRNKWIAAAPFVILLTVAGCELEKFTLPTPAVSALDTFIVSSRSLVADGASQVIMTAIVPPPMRGKVTSVQFTTTSGSFGASATSITAAVNDSGRARAVLTAPGAPTVIFVSASAFATVKTDSIFASVALPDTMSVSAAGALLRADTLTVVNEVLVTAQLTRRNGMAGSGLTVEWSASAANGVSPVFSAVTLSSASGVATAKYSPGLTSYRGPVTVTAKTKGANGGTLTASAIVYLLPPEPPPTPKDE